MGARLRHLGAATCPALHRKGPRRGCMLVAKVLDEHRVKPFQNSAEVRELQVLHVFLTGIPKMGAFSRAPQLDKCSRSCVDGSQAQQQHTIPSLMEARFPGSLENSSNKSYS
ncbi:uncharacterized protein ACIGJ3_017569 [Trichechus inunguis]